jgi:hypothetical protein
LKRKRLNFWQNCELIPPILIRLMAKRTRSEPMTDLEISKLSGLSLDHILMIQHMTSWSLISFDVARKFMWGCGIDFCNGAQMDRAKSYLCREGIKQPKWKYLRTSPEWKSKYEPLLRRYLKSLSQ